MDTSKKGRGRSKSSNSAEPSESVDDNASNLNGEDAAINVKQDEPDTKSDNTRSKDDEKVSEKTEEKSDSGKDKTVKSRKRKASEMKSGEESFEEVSKELKASQDKEEVVADEDTVNSSKNKESKKDVPEKKREQAAKESSDKDTAKVTEAKTKTTDKDPPTTDNSGPDDMPAKQTLGKGKRARIPNKRYSDILLTPSGGKGNATKPVENGEKRISEKIESEDETAHPAVTSLKSRASTGSPFSKKPKLSFDLSNPNFLKPFKFGWKRELVYRATNDNSHKRNSDIYYYTPTGKKVRSMREVGEHLDLTSGLSLEDFTFFKEPLGIDDPEKEIIRDAKRLLGSGTGNTLLKKSLTPKVVKTPKPKEVKTPTSPKLPVSTPKTVTPAVTKAKTLAKATTPKASPVHVSSENSFNETPTKTKSPSKLGNFKIKPPSKKADKKAKLDESMEVEAGPSKWAAKKGGKWANSDNKPCQPCSIRCPAMMGVVPTLQCRLCLCLYHHECVGIPQECDTQNYVCKNCYLDQEKSAGSISSPPHVPPPPLTPINSLKTSTPSVKSAALPKLQRIPRPGDASPHPPPTVTTKEMPRLVPRPLQPKILKVSETFPPPLESKGLVGSVTSWLPQNSKIQVDNQRSDVSVADSPLPQFVEYLAGRKFLIIPKHNIVSVSPTIAVTANTRPEEVNAPESNKASIDSASLGLKEACDIKPEPESPSKPENTQTEAMDVDTCTEFNVAEKSLNQAEQVENGTEKDTPSKTTPKKRPSARLNSSILASSDKKLDDSKFMDNYLQHLAYGYNTLLYVFQYLKVQDLLRAGCVCTMWRDIASHPILWRTVRLKNSSVHSFEGLANTLQKHGTVHLDLRKMILPSAGEDMWPEFNKAIKKVTTLRKIELCRCPASVIEQLAISNPKLEIVNAVAIKCETMNLDHLANFTDLKELRLKSISGFALSSDLDALKELKSLRHLSLTSIRDLNKLNLSTLAELSNLDSLDLGECMDFPKNFGSDILLKLPKLEKLRLEKGQGNCHTFEILEAVKKMPNLEQLELVNFDIKAGFDKALGNCTNIKRLLIIPTYISQSATTNHMVLGGVLRLQKTLSHFVWGVTLELLRVTELFVDQCEEPEKKEKKDKDKDKDKDKKQAGNGDSIPVLKPVPLITEKETEIHPAFDPPQVEILPLPNLQKLLLQSLPTTRVKILKIPFHATWRQSITDSVN